ncbi:MAG: ABC transporter ATP-binding protein [Bacteroidetes bacterium]|nr:ABC transporter ATP-binding protein [Bacteroidota bacterium]
MNQTGELILHDNNLVMKNLSTFFHIEEGVLKAVNNVSFTVPKGKTIGIIGESGSGKSVTAQSILRIVPDPGKIENGSIHIRTSDGNVVDLTTLNPKGAEIRRIRWNDVSMIFQEPMTSLSTVHTIGSQIIEAINLHRPGDKLNARDITLDLLDKVGISNPHQRIDEYPFQLSGGMRQRAMIAMALSCNPRILLADEPTTALDVTVQAQILELLADLQSQFAMSMVYITHDLGVISDIADEVHVMYLGKIVESATVYEIFRNPLHPYTKGLIKSIPTFSSTRKERLVPIKGNVPIPINLPNCCGFFNRCPQAIKGKCDCKQPALVNHDEHHSVRCFLVNDNIEGDADEQ